MINLNTKEHPLLIPGIFGIFGPPWESQLPPAELIFSEE